MNGYTTLHRELEERLAEFKHCEAAMLFSAGFMANLGWATGLLGPSDVLVYDQQSHASLYDAIQLGRFEAVHFNHNDMDHLRRRLMQVRWKHAYTNVIVCVEGVYSMDGDIAPLPEIRRLCDQYAALLAIDDAHGTGVLGERGGGTPEHFGMEGSIDIVMGTFSKIFAVTGGFVAGKRDVINYMRLLSRPYMFSASLPPPVVGSVLAGLDFLRDHPERVKQLHDNVAYLVDGLRAVGFETDVQTAIIPILVPAPINLHQVISRLFEEGIFVNGVEYPAVPRDRHRIRMSVMATLTRADLDYVIDKTAKVGRELGFLGSRSGVNATERLLVLSTLAAYQPAERADAARLARDGRRLGSLLRPGRVERHGAARVEEPACTWRRGSRCRRGCRRDSRIVPRRSARPTRRG